MKKNTTAALLTAFLAFLPVGVHAQAVYRCGDSYSQQPCAGGQALPDDSRTAAQRAQTAAAAKTDAKLADSLEKDRLKREAQPASGYIPAATPAEEKPRATTKPRQPEVFKAVAPAPPKAKPPKKKKAAKKAA